MLRSSSTCCGLWLGWADRYRDSGIGQRGVRVTVMPATVTLSMMVVATVVEIAMVGIALGEGSWACVR